MQETAINYEKMYELLMLARKIDERFWQLNRAGEAPFVISGKGHEGFQVALAQLLDQKIDWMAPYYRDLPLVLGFGETPKSVFLNLLSKAEDTNSGGRQMAFHWGNKANHILSHSSPVTTQFLHACGVALALKKQGEPGIVVTTVGDGSTSQGDFHEALNFASVFNLPVLFIIENNHIAMSVAQEDQYKQKDFSGFGQAYQMKYAKIEGTSVMASYQDLQEIIEEMRAHPQPVLVEADVVRLTAHSSDDDGSYLNEQERNYQENKDPVLIFQNDLLTRQLLSKEKMTEIEETISDLIDEVTEEALEAADPAAQTLEKFVYEEGEDK